MKGITGPLLDAIGRASKKFLPLPKNKPGQIGHQKFDYAPYHTIRKCILNHLLEEGVTFIQPIHSHGTSCAVTLVVSGHGASIETTLKFDMNPKPQEFGKESTYYRRYQLQSFFCLEGDKDADDLEDPVAEDKKESVKEAVKTDDKPKASVDTVKPSDSNGTPAKPAEEVKVVKQDPKAVAQLLMEGMKFLKWNMSDMDAFCKEHFEHFPGYVNPTKLNDNGKATLLALLVKHKGVIPF
jgi:hypothetical protein